ncbi:ubiquitin-like protein [Aurantibacter sp.]|uniref:ubiquitin-like protein n=1 Tax=Aurantibacter sp. TaxID=2807103 RepID=UPI0035C7F95E
MKKIILICILFFFSNGINAQASGLLIYVRIPDGNGSQYTSSIDALYSDTILVLKQKIQINEGIDPNTFDLLSFTGSLLEESRTIAEYNILNESTIYLRYNDTLSIEQVNFDDSLSILPNPSIGQVTISTEQIFQELHVKILSITGQTMIENKYYNTNKIALSFEGNSGLYLIKIKNENGIIITKKIIKE